VSARQVLSYVLSYVLPSRLWLVALLIAAVALPFAAPPYYTQLASKILLMGLAAMSLNLVVGFGGLVSMCHAAFFGLSGYLLAMLAPRYEPASFFLTLPLATGGSALVALLIGVLSLRTRGIYFIMVTLAFGQMLFFVFHDTTIGGGSDGAYIYYKPDVAIAGVRLVNLENVTGFYLTVLAVVLIAILLLRAITTSPFGHALVAARDNERRARSLGFPIYRLHLTSFVISGALAGVAGYFAAAQFGFVAPQMLGWHLSAILLVMVLLGGMRSVTGPLLGAAILLGLEEILQGVTEHWKLVEGTMIILIVLARPSLLRRCAKLFTAFNVTSPASRQPLKTTSPFGKAGNA
jgi:branched-chain amino acid transport system permease protein